VNRVLDTNVVIYLQKGLLRESLPLGRYFLSVISEIELFSFAGLSSAQEEALRDLCADVAVAGITEEIKGEAIRLRREHRLRVPDAIVGATALCLDAELLTNDVALAGLPGMKVRTVALKAPP
jgi:hypothetical protein